MTSYADRQGYFDTPLAQFLTNSKNWEVAATILYPGSDAVGPPKEFKIVAGRRTGSVQLDVRVYDVKAAAVVAEAVDVDIQWPSIITLSAPANISRKETVWEIHVRRKDASEAKDVAVGTLQTRY